MAKNQSSSKKTLSNSKATDYDSPWKQIIEELLEPFLEFFFPPIHADIDFSRGYEVKSKELYKLLKDQYIGKRYTDELIKVYLKDGPETWLLIHIEVQNYIEKDFAKRMYIYNYRIFDKYNHEVVSLVILTDPYETYRPDTYIHKRWNFKHIMEFPVIKIIDYKSHIAELEKMSNPMAVVVLAQLKSIEIKTKTPDIKFDIKFTLIRMLFRKGFTKKQIYDIFKFIDWLILLPEDLENKITDEIIKLEKEQKMTYVTHMERIAEKKGELKGKLKGKLEGKLEVAENMLKNGFSVKDIMKNTGLSKEEIMTLQEKIEKEE